LRRAGKLFILRVIFHRKNLQKGVNVTVIKSTIAFIAASAVMAFCQEPSAAGPQELGVRPLSVTPSLGPYVSVKIPFFPCVAVAGSTGDMNETIFVCTIDSAGNELWRKSYSTFPECQRLGAHYVNALVALDDGGFLVAGSRCVCVGSGSRDAWIMRVDRSGGMLWCAVIPDSGTMEGHGYSVRCVSAIGGGFFAVAGSKNNGAWMAGIDRAGKVLWSCGCEGSAVLSVASAPDCGIFTVSSSGSASLSTIYISRTGNDGTFRWVHSASFCPAPGAPAFAPLACITNDYTVCAAFATSQTGFDVMTLDTAANSLWQQHVCLCATGCRTLQSLVPDASGGFLVAGFGAPDRYTAAQNSWLVRLRQSGDIAWQWSTADAQVLHSVVMEDGNFLGFLGERYTTSSTELVLVNLYDNPAIAPSTAVRAPKALLPVRFAAQASGAKRFDVLGRQVRAGAGSSMNIASGVYISDHSLSPHCR
jgi:hypothetical protein